MSTDGSIGTYLFDDDAVNLHVNLDDARRNGISNESTHGPPPWCMSSSCSRSCCSLCRPPAVSEAEDDSNGCRLSEAEAKCPPASRPSGAADGRAVPSISLCGGNCAGSSSCLSVCRSFLRVPIKSIEIPRSCLDKSLSAEVQQKVFYGDGNDYLSTSFLPDDALCHIVNFLGVASLAQLRECNRKLRHAASINSAGWQNHALCLWSSKVSVCHDARELLAESRKPAKETSSIRAYMAMEAYKASIVDATTRQEITSEELCFDVSGIRWSFQEGAGRDWAPHIWWAGQDARQMVFLADGTMLQAHPRGAGGPVRVCRGTPLWDALSEHDVRRDGAAGTGARRITMTWRFVRRPLDLDRRSLGAYVRVAVSGRDMPTYVVRRATDGSWGWVLESCLGFYTSCDRAPRALTVTALGPRLLHQTRDGGRWSDAERSDDEGRPGRENLRNVRQRTNLFVGEYPRHSQWREALLCSFGAVTLPDGNVGPEFDNMWRNALMLRWAPLVMP